MKRQWADGTEAFVLDPLDFIARLCTLVPPPYFHMTRYSGVLASRSRLRREVVRTLATPLPPGQQLDLPFDLPKLRPWRRPNLSPPRKTPGKGRHPWAYLLARTFRVDVTICPRCSGPLRLVELAMTPEAIRRVMTRAGLVAMPPPPLPVVRRQLELEIATC